MLGPSRSYGLGLCQLSVLAAVAVIWLGMPADVGATLTIDADSQYRYAHSRLDAGAFDEAIGEFERFIYFFPDDPRVPRSRFHQGMAHYRAARYAQAAVSFDALTAAHAGSDLGSDAFFMLSRSHARQGMLERAMLDLHNLMAVDARIDIIDRARYELGWLQVERGHWQDAERAFGRITADNRDRFNIQALQTDLNRRANLPHKSPTVAGMLSIVPGAGQLYCQRYQDALTAFLINAGLIWAAWESFDQELYGLGSVITFVEIGFYAGNITGAISSAHKFNRDRVAAFRDRLTTHRRGPLSLAPVPGGAVLALYLDF